MQAGMVKKEALLPGVFTSQVRLFIFLDGGGRTVLQIGSQVCPVWALEGEWLNNTCLKKHRILAVVRR